MRSRAPSWAGLVRRLCCGQNGRRSRGHRGWRRLGPGVRRRRGIRAHVLQAQGGPSPVSGAARARSAWRPAPGAEPRPRPLCRVAAEPVGLPHAAPLDFDDLPIAFRAVATDLEAGTVVEIGSGSLASALRATMAISSRSCATAACWPTAACSTTCPPMSSAGWAWMSSSRSTSAYRSIPVKSCRPGWPGGPSPCADDERAHAQGPWRPRDHVIAPTLEGVSVMDWRRFDTIRALGYRAAAARAGSWPISRCHRRRGSGISRSGVSEPLSRRSCRSSYAWRA